MTPLETSLARKFPTYALEQLRVRFLFSASTKRDIATGAAIAAQMAFETEIGVVLEKVALPSPSTMAAVIPTRRRFLDVDADMRANRFLVEPALDELLPLGIPDPYINLLRRHLSGDYPRYRMCALAATLCLATASIP